MGTDHDIFDLCRAQHGLVTLEQLADLGLASASIADRVACGWFERVDHRVFRLRAAPQTWSQQVASLVLTSGPEALAARRSAAALWRLAGARRSQVEVVVPRWSRRHPRGGRVIESLDLRPIDRRVCDGIPTTAPARTLFDCAAKVHPALLAQMADDAVAQGLVTFDQVLDRFVQLARRGRPGTVRMRELLDERLSLGLTRANTFEALVVRIAMAAGVPMPVSQHPVEVAGRRFVLDLAWPVQRVCVECDGWATHGTATALQGDLERQNLLVLDGWTVLRFAWRTVADDPGLVRRQLRSVLPRA